MTWRRRATFARPYVEVLILDEVDCLLDGGFAQNIATIVAALPAARQTLAFSATVPKKVLPTLSVALRGDHTVVDCVGEEVVDTHALVTQKMLIHPLELSLLAGPQDCLLIVYRCTHPYTLATSSSPRPWPGHSFPDLTVCSQCTGLSLLALLDCIRGEMRARPDDYKVLAFLPTARQTQFSAAVMTQMGLTVLEIHGRRTAGDRVLASDTFRDNVQQVMLSSDVSARGVDYPVGRCPVTLSNLC